MKKILKRLATGFLAFATIVTALPTTAVHASEKQYWTESAERVGIVEKVMNDGSIGSTFNEGHMTVEGEDAFCVDINTNFRNGYKTRADASTRMSYDQISDVALSIEYVNQYVQSHSGLSSQHIYLLKQCVVWQRLSVHLGWQCDNVRASYDEIPKAIQDATINTRIIVLETDMCQYFRIFIRSHLFSCRRSDAQGKYIIIIQVAYFSNLIQVDMDISRRIQFSTFNIP